MKRDRSLTWRHVDESKLDLKGMKVAVIGGTGGIGRALSRNLASHGASVLVVGQTFRDDGVSGIEFVKADLSLMSEASHVADTLRAETLDIVIFTTGIMAGPKREVTTEGIERDMAISFLSRFVILENIAPRLGKDRTNARMKPRVFVMGFPGSNQTGDVDDLNSEKKYGRWSAHMKTVAGNEAMVLEASRRFPDIDVFGLNPGFVKTDIRGNLFGSKLLLKVMELMTSFMTIKPEKYAERLTPLLVSPDVEGRSGSMFNHQAEAILPSTKMTEDHISAFLGGSRALVSKVELRHK